MIDEKTWIFIANSWSTAIALILIFGAVIIYLNESAKKQKRSKK